ncbi:acetyl-CoA sensor PanZ family protein [Oceanisphaera avium]|uniref:GNAT family N-acetyltransferase n=1 Tax=Oceanisphaera avium TaxID=1903694 RepID=A0A1Y0CZ19_9GAMM|nr:acetyl-CoA sensor PanZ family protein [Oceanisphaera avium]ART80581.1 GNAT family N-acetyltransferase [Oceanisphaera avium]
MRLTIHNVKHIPAQHHAHVALILEGQPLPEQAEFYLATFNDKAVALAWCEQQQLSFIAVRDITRRRGIGQELLRVIKHAAKQQGYSQLTCQPQAKPNQQAGLVAFLQSQGFNGQTPVLSCNLE